MHLINLLRDKVSTRLRQLEIVMFMTQKHAVVTSQFAAKLPTLGEGNSILPMRF